jgi:hypothetical protein
MKRMLLTTTAAVACLMLTPSAEARSTSRPEQAVAVSIEAGDGTDDRFVAVAQAAPDDEDDEDEDDDEDQNEDDDEEDDSDDEEEDEDEDDEGDEDDENATADPVPGAVTGGQDDIAADDADADEDESEDEEDDGEEDDPFPSVPGTLNATIGGTATLQAGVFGDLTHGVQFRNQTELDFNVRGKADNGLLYGLKLQLETVTGNESSSETTFDEAYVYIGGPWGRLEFGDTDDVVAGGLLIYAPSVGIGQVDGDYGSFSRLSLDDYYPFYPDIGTSTKINYYTPRIAGFQAGISYSPYLSDNGQSVVAFRPGRVRGTTASAPSRSLSSASAIPRTAIPQTIVRSASLSPRTVTRASAPAPTRVAQTVEDDEDDGEDSEDDSGDDDGEDDDDDPDDGPDTDDPDEPDEPDDPDEPDEPDAPDEPDTPDQPDAPDQPTPEQPSPEQPTPEQPDPGEPVPPVVEPEPETPVVEEPEDEDEDEDEEESGYRDVTSFAVNYQKEFENLTFSGSAAVINGNGYGPGSKDFTAWVTGIQFGISDFTVGGGFGKFDGYADLDWQWNVGATYEAGPFGIGAQYAWVRDVNGDHSWAAGIGVNYVLAPGLSLQADYVHSKVNFTRSENVNTSDVILLGLQLSF